jgi:hypothetical protein
MIEMTPQQIAATDQWIADLHEKIKGPIEAIRRRVLNADDPSNAYVGLCQEMRMGCDMSPEFLTYLVMSYVSALYVLASREGK